MKKAITKNNKVIRWPATLEMLRKINPDASIPKTAQAPITVGETTLQNPVPVPAPSGEVVVELIPEFVGGTLTQQWEARDMTEVEFLQMKTRISNAITSKRIEVLSGGKSYLFPDGETGTVETTESDLLNLTAVSNRAQQGDGAFVWKDQENDVHPLTAADAIALGNHVFDWQQDVWAHSFVLKTTVQNASDFATLDAIDIDTGWPE